MDRFTNNKPNPLKIAIIGGGAAGFFAGLSAKIHHRNASVTIFEKSSKLLGKVKVSGGGRCNVTIANPSKKAVLDAYPRGGKFLRKIFEQFDRDDTVQWFLSRGVKLVTEPDLRMFPSTNSSQTVINCLMRQASKLKIEIKTSSPVDSIQVHPKGFELKFRSDVKHFDRVIIAVGGTPKLKGLKWLMQLGHRIEKPVPSLFTFNIRNSGLCDLSGIAIPCAKIAIRSTKYQSKGPVLITHWGISGPCVLKLSSLAAKLLAEKQYNFIMQVNWVDQREDLLRDLLLQTIARNSQKQMENIHLLELPKNLWKYLLDKAGIKKAKKCTELGKKEINKLCQTIVNDYYEVSGKTTFKDEFVTCGGLSLLDINPVNMESRIHPGLYFAGEIMDIDGITGGYNFQAAWSTGYVAGQLNKP